MANRSDYGWEVVKEYETDQLASSSDDEKRRQLKGKFWREGRGCQSTEEVQINMPHIGETGISWERAPQVLTGSPDLLHLTFQVLE